MDPQTGPAQIRHGRQPRLSERNGRRSNIVGPKRVAERNPGIEPNVSTRHQHDRTPTTASANDVECMLVGANSVGHLDLLRASEHQGRALEFNDDQAGFLHRWRLECMERGCITAPAEDGPARHVSAGPRLDTTPTTPPGPQPMPGAADRRTASKPGTRAAQRRELARTGVVATIRRGRNGEPARSLSPTAMVGRSGREARRTRCEWVS